MMSVISIIFFERLRELALAATPGNWRQSPNASDAIIADPVPGQRELSNSERDHYGGLVIGESMSEANRRYIEMLSPPATLALLATLLRLVDSPLTLDQARVIRSWAVDLECSNGRVAELFAYTWGGDTGQDRGDRLCIEARKLLGEAW
jgi:hypothetical protein